MFPKLAAQVRHLDQIGIRGWLGEVTELKSTITKKDDDIIKCQQTVEHLERNLTSGKLRQADRN